MTTLAELKALAEAATITWSDNCDVPDCTCHETREDFIAAANPATILQMIAVMEMMSDALEMYMSEEDIPWSVVEAALAAYKEMMK